MSQENLHPDGAIFCSQRVPNLNNPIVHGGGQEVEDEGIQKSVACAWKQSHGAPPNILPIDEAYNMGYVIRAKTEDKNRQSGHGYPYCATFLPQMEMRPNQDTDASSVAKSCD